MLGRRYAPAARAPEAAQATSIREKEAAEFKEEEKDLVQARRRLPVSQTRCDSSGVRDSRGCRRPGFLGGLREGSSKQTMKSSPPDPWRSPSNCGSQFVCAMEESAKFLEDSVKFSERPAGKPSKKWKAQLGGNPAAAVARILSLHGPIHSAARRRTRQQVRDPGGCPDPGYRTCDAIGHLGNN